MADVVKPKPGITPKKLTINGLNHLVVGFNPSTHPNTWGPQIGCFIDLTKSELQIGYPIEPLMAINGLLVLRF